MPASDQPSISNPQEKGNGPGSESQPIRIATRESPLAMWQARHTADLLREEGISSTIVPLVSSGDVDMRPIDGRRSVGVFTKRIQQALLEDEGDVAVHSMKDLPTEVVPELRMTASPARETVEDCLVSPNAFELDSLPKGARIGTGSRRRAAQLLRCRSDLQILPIRGNVQTRLQKMNSGEYDAIILAAAGIERLEMHDLPRVALSLDVMLPAPGQGALAIEVRSADDASVSITQTISDAETMACTTAERTMLAALHGGCLAPIAAYASISEGQLTLLGRVLSADGVECLEASGTVAWEQSTAGASAQALGKQVSEDLLGQGAKRLIDAQR